MKKQKKDMFEVDWVIFPFHVLVCLGSTREDILRKLKNLRYEVSEKEIDQINMSGIGRCVMLENGGTILWIRDYPNEAGSLSCITHEVFHAVYFLLGRVGIEISDDSDELVAYMQGYLVNKILNRIAKK